MREDIKTSLIFLLGTLLWIEFTDYLVFEFLVDGNSFAYYSHIKGIIYSFLATAFVFYTVRKRTAQLRKVNEILENEVEEKEILNMEVHHRVKNNLALISAMIELQIMQIHDKRLIDQLQKVKLRIHAIAQIEEQIYQTESLKGVHINTFLEEYLAHISVALNHKSEFINKCPESVQMSLNQAIPLGIIINELINLISDFDAETKSTDIRVISEKENAMFKLVFFCHTDTDLNLVFGSDSVQALIIRLYVEQLDIVMNLDRDDSGCQKICFSVPISSSRKGAYSNYSY